MSRHVRSCGTSPGGWRLILISAIWATAPPGVQKPSHPACLGEHSTLSVSFWYGSHKNHRPLTVPRGSPVRRGRGEMQIRKTEDAPKRLCFCCWQRPKVTVNIHCCRWVGLLEKLTEQWVQLWPRSAQLLSPPISRPDTKDSDLLIYVLLVFHCYFPHSSSLARSLQG